MRRRPRHCPCGAAVVWAKDDAGRWVEIDGQSTIDRTIVGPLVLWWVGDGQQRVSRLDDFEKIHGPYKGPVWRVHFPICPEVERSSGWPVSVKGRRLLAVMGRRGGRA